MTENNFKIFTHSMYSNQHHFSTAISTIVVPGDPYASATFAPVPIQSV